MANVPESAVYDAGVYQYEIDDPVQGGATGLSNAPLKNLANRTAYLKVHTDQLEAGTTIPPTVAPKNSPVFTGDPQVPTPALGDADSSIANTLFVQNTVNGELLKSVAGGVNVVLTAVEAGYGMYEFTGALTANIAVIVPTSNKKISVKNSTSGAFALTVKTASGTGIIVAQGKQRQLLCDGTNVIDAHNDLDLSNAALTGIPTAPTAVAGTNTPQIATMAALQAGLATVMSQAAADARYAGLAGATFTGPVAGPTTAQFDASTKLATMAALQRAGWATGFASGFSAGAVLTAAHSGKVCVLNGAPGAVTLPLASTFPSDRSGVIALWVNGGGWTLNRAGADTIYMGVSTATSLQLNAGDTLLLASDGGAGWFAIGGSAQLPYASALNYKAPLDSPAFTGNPTAPTPTQFDNDASLATTAFVQKALGNFAGITGFGGSQNLSVGDCGKIIEYFGTAPGTFTLPLLSTLPPAGAGYLIKNDSGFSLTTGRSGTDGIIGAGGATSVLLGPGDTLQVFGIPSNWYVIGGSVANYAPADGRYAKLAGLATQIFRVANAVGTNDAVPLGQVFGIGQTLQDVTASRAPLTNYTNSTGKPILINVATRLASGTSWLQLVIDGLVYYGPITPPVANSFTALTMVIPSGSTYQLQANIDGGGTTPITLITWKELR